MGWCRANAHADLGQHLPELPAGGRKSYLNSMTRPKNASALIGMKRTYTLKLFAEGEEARELFASLANEACVALLRFSR